MTHSNSSAIRAALSTGVFFINPQAVGAHLSTAVQFLKGTYTDYAPEQEPWRKSMNVSNAPTVTNACYTPRYTYGVGWSFPDLSQENNGICVLCIDDVIMKNDGWCNYGMLTFVDWLRLAESTPNINSVVIRMDTPGGEAQICEYVETQIASMKKPVLVHCHGLMCSAGYYIASPADAIYCESNSDLIGCIGSMATLVDYKTYMQNEGIPVHEIYADGSEEKNIQYRQAMEGNYQPYKDKILNPLRNQFVDVVKKNRPQCADECLLGDMYFGNDAKRLGLIDGIQSYSATIAEAYNLGMQYSLSNL